MAKVIRLPKNTKGRDFVVGDIHGCFSLLEKALEKIREGTYGKCEHCPKKVPLARLKALPYATTCIECQRLSEEGRLDSSGDADWNRVLDAGGDNEVTFSDIEIDVS